MGGTKRKIKIEKIQNKTVKSVAFTKRRIGLFRKASELCLLSRGTQIAILTTPPSSNSHANFYSFGHSSVDHVVSSFLNDQLPLPVTNHSELGYCWWEDEAFNRCENVDELNNAAGAITRMLTNLRVRADALDSNRITVFEGTSASASANLLEIDEVMNSSEDAMNQITKSEGTSSASTKWFENDEELQNLLNDFDFDSLPEF